MRCQRKWPSGAAAAAADKERRGPAGHSWRRPISARSITRERQAATISGRAQFGARRPTGSLVDRMAGRCARRTPSINWPAERGGSAKRVARSARQTRPLALSARRRRTAGARTRARILIFIVVIIISVLSLASHLFVCSSLSLSLRELQEWRRRRGRKKEKERGKGEQLIRERRARSLLSSAPMQKVNESSWNWRSGSTCATIASVSPLSPPPLLLPVVVF